MHTDFPNLNTLYSVLPPLHSLSLFSSSSERISRSTCRPHYLEEPLDRPDCRQEILGRSPKHLAFDCFELRQWSTSDKKRIVLLPTKWISFFRCATRSSSTACTQHCSPSDLESPTLS